MKAYEAWDAGSYEGYNTVVFAETANAAKVIAMGTEACEDAEYIDIRVKRLPEMDGHYRGRSEIDWDDPEDRKALVSLGWACFETSRLCDYCPAKSVCRNTTEDDPGVKWAQRAAKVATGKQ